MTRYEAVIRILNYQVAACKEVVQQFVDKFDAAVVKSLNFDNGSREFIPKGRSIGDFSDEHIKRAIAALNQRSRKIFGCKSANEFMTEQLLERPTSRPLISEI